MAPGGSPDRSRRARRRVPLWDPCRGGLGRQPHAESLRRPRLGAPSGTTDRGKQWVRTRGDLRSGPDRRAGAMACRFAASLDWTCDGALQFVVRGFEPAGREPVPCPAQPEPRLFVPHRANLGTPRQLCAALERRSLVGPRLPVVRAGQDRATTAGASGRPRGDGYSGEPSRCAPTESHPWPQPSRLRPPRSFAFAR